MIKPTTKITFPKFENAQTFVEFALVFPIVLLITYGIIEFGRMVFIYTAVTGSAREGARYGAAAGNLTTRYYMDCAGILDAVQRGAILIPINNGDVSIWYDHGPNTTRIKNSCPPIDANGMDLINMGDRIGVHVIAHYSPVIAFLGLHGFDIISENARTILVNVDVVGTAAAPVATNTSTKTPGPYYTPTKTPTITITPSPTLSPTPRNTSTPGGPSDTPETPTLTATPVCVVSGGGFEFHSNYFRWTLTSLSTNLIRLDSASISWPAPPTPTVLPPLAITPTSLVAPTSGSSGAHIPPGILVKTPPPDPPKTDTPTPTATSSPTPTSTYTPVFTPGPSPTSTSTPVPLPNLIEIDVGVYQVWLGMQPPPSASVGSWLSDESRRELSPGASHTTSYYFYMDLPPGGYEVTLNYMDVNSGLTCSVSYSTNYQP
jgi:hypothetical protein